ncbi:uncharacterized protein LOC128396139 isoform X2 [Panonychus citri]|uniref:uncharacterized protein LOC128396139 isoform X2 n=1 Tax=Panonychus citri TaxID=50023 RepID=UPI002307575E|nr:uncharacterized protein LOC128396139 isoform X2 [Panonychus citri]
MASQQVPNLISHLLITKHQTYDRQLSPHSSLPTTTFEDNLTFGVGAGLTGRASPCGHFYYSPCAISASQLSIGASQKHSPSTKVSSDQHHHHHHHPKQQANNIKNKQVPSSVLEKSVNLNPTNQKCPQLKSSSSSSSSQQLKHNQCPEFVDLQEKLLVDSKTVQSSSKVNNDDNFMLDLTAFSLNCDEINSNNNSSNPNKVTSNCLTSSSLTPTIKSSSVNNYQSALHNHTNHNKNFNHCSNEINNNVKYNKYSNDEIDNDKHLNQSNYQCNGISHNLIFDSNNAFSESPPEGIVNGKGSGGNHMNINQHFRHHESNSLTQSPTSSTTMTQAKSNGLMNGENVLFNESNCSYINHNNSSNMNTIKIEVELTRSPSIQSYTSNSMISPRRKRKGPAPPPPIISAFEPFPGSSGISLSPPSSSSSSPSSLAVTPTHSPLPGPSNVSSANVNSTSSKSLITSKSSNVVNLYPCPPISGCSKFNDNLTMGRKKSIKNKPAPSPPPPLPTLPPLASRPKSLIQGASSRPHDTRGAFTSSPVVMKVNESSPSSTPFTLGHCSSHSVSTSCRNNNSLSSPNQSPTKHNNCRPIAIRYLPCRSHSVSVCPIATLTRSLSDQKQINGKDMLRSVTSYSSDLNLPKFTRLSGLINSPTGSSVFQHEQTLESDSIIIKYDDPDYFYPMITNCYSSCELPYIIDNEANESEIVHQEDGKLNCDHITVPTTPIRRKRQKEYKMMNKSQSFTSSSLFPEAGKGLPSGLPPRPPSPRIDSNSYKMVNRSIPQTPVRTRQRSRPTSICFANHCCRLDQSSNYKIAQNIAMRSSSLNSMKSRSSPSTPNISRNLHSSCSLPRIDSALTFTHSTLSESLPDSHQGENSITCTNCSLCGLKGAVERRPETTRTTENNGLEIVKSKDETVVKDETSTIEEPIYEEIDFGLISENVAALLSPRQLMNSANNKLRSRADKNTCKDANDSGEMMMTSCNNKINMSPIDTLKARKISSGTGGERKEDDAMMERVIGHHNSNSGGEILSDTSDDRVTVKSMISHNNNNQLKPWAYSSSSLDSEQSTTSSGSTVKQWANQIVSYSSKSHYHPLHGGSSGSTPTTSSTCYHGDHPELYRIQCIGHHHFHHNDENNQKHLHHPHLVSLSPSSTPEQRQHFYHCPHHHHHHHLPHHRHYHHHGHRMITTSTSDHSLSSLSSSNFSEDPTTTTPTPPNISTALHDDYNFIYLPDDSPVGHHCSDLDETNEDEDEDEDVTVDEDDVEEEEVIICDDILLRGEAKNDFGKRTCCYSDPFYQTQDLQGDDEDDGEDEREVDGDHGGRNKLKEKKTEEESGKGNDEKTSLETTPTSQVYSQKIESPICSTKLNDVKSVHVSTASHFPSSLSSSNIHNSKKTRSLSSLNYHNRISCDQIAANQSTCHCHQCYHHSQQHFIGTRSYHQHRTNQNNYQQPTKTFNKSGSEDNMASSWNGSGPFANENHQNQTQNYNHNENNDGNNINRLMQELQLAINYGQHRKAALLARQLALRKVSCSFNQSTANSTGTFGSNDQPIIVYLYIEDKQSRQGPFPIQLYPSMTVKMLKEKVEGDFGFPVNIQSWILGKCLATNEDALLSTFGIILSGCPIFLYLLSNNNTTDQVTINDNNPLGQNLSTPTFGEKTQHDENEDKSGNHDDQNQGNATFITNDTKEMKGGKRSVSIAGKLSSNGESENINENHADHHENNEKNDLVGGKSSSDIASGSGSSGEVSKGLATSIDATISMRPIQRRSKGTKVTSTISSPSTSKSTPKLIETHGEDLNHHYPLSALNQVKDQLIRKADKISTESPRRQNRKIQSTLKHNDIKMMQAHDYQASSSGASKLNNDNNKVNNINMIQKQQLLIINSIKNQGDNHSNDNNGSGNVDNDDNKGNGCNKEAEKVGQQVKGDEDENQTGDEDNQVDDNEPEIESKGEMSETYKQLMALDDVDLVKNSEDFECPICFLNIHKEKGVVLRDCLHMFCRECLCNSVEFCDEALVKCPYRSDDYYCDSTITDREIKSLASDELYQKHLARSMKAAELKSAKSFHCKTADCPGWCEYDDNVNTFPCPVCGKVNCLTCQAIHEEMNCRQYQDALEFEAAESNEDAKKTKQFLDNMLDKGEALRCPICFVILIKKWGCDWVKCSMCHSEICWVTKGPRWGPGGKGDISGGCKCMINGQKCHPKCNYCH